MKASPGDSGCGKNAVKAMPTKSAMSAIGILLKFRFTRFDADLNISPRAMPNRVAVDDSDDGACWSASIPPGLSLLKTRTFMVAKFSGFPLPAIVPSGTNSCRWLFLLLLLVLRRFLTVEVVVVVDSDDVVAVFLLSEAIFIAATRVPFLLFPLPTPNRDGDDGTFGVVVLVALVVVVAILLPLQQSLVLLLLLLFLKIGERRRRRRKFSTE
jgi:hypothetical protein